MTICETHKLCLTIEKKKFYLRESRSGGWLESDYVSLEQPEYKWLLTSCPLPFSPPPPPLCSGAPPPSHTMSLITILFVTSHPATPGVFHKNFLWYKLLALICIKTLPFVYTLGMTFRAFTQHFVAEKCTLSLPDNNFEKSFSCSFTIALLYANYLFRRNKTPLTLQEQSPWLLWGKGRCENDYQQQFKILLAAHTNSTFKICIC